MNNEYFRSNEENQFSEYKPFLAEEYRPKSEIGEKTIEMTSVPEENEDNRSQQKPKDNNNVKDIIDKMTKSSTVASTTVATSGAALSMAAVVGVVAVGGALAALPKVPGKTQFSDFDVGADYLYYSFVLEDTLDEFDYFVELSDNSGEEQRYRIITGENEELIDNLTPHTDYKFEVVGVEFPEINEHHENHEMPEGMPHEEISEEQLKKQVLFTKEFTTLSDTSAKALLRTMEPFDTGQGGFNLPFNLYVSDYEHLYGGFKIKLYFEDMLVRDYYMELKGNYSDVIENLKQGNYRFEIYGFGENGEVKIDEKNYVSQYGEVVKGAKAQFNVLNIGGDFVQYSVNLENTSEGYEYNMSLMSYELNKIIKLTEGNKKEWLTDLVLDNDYFVEITMEKGKERYVLYNGSFKTKVTREPFALMTVTENNFEAQKKANLNLELLISDYDGLYYSYKVAMYYDNVLFDELYYYETGLIKDVVSDIKKGEYKFEVYALNDSGDLLLATTNYTCNNAYELTGPVIYSVDVNKEYNSISIDSNKLVPKGMRTVVKNESTGEVVDLSQFDGAMIPEAVTEYSYYWVNESNVISSEVKKFTIDSSITAGRYNINCVNPGDILKTYNEDGTFNVYIDVMFNSEDPDLYYQIAYNTIAGRELLHSTSPVAVMENVVKDFSIVYEVQKTIGIVDYIFQQTPVSGTTEDDRKDYHFEGSGVSQATQGGSSLDIVVSNNLMFGDGGYIVTDSGVKIDINTTDFTDYPEEYCHKASIIVPDSVFEFEIYLYASPFADKYDLIDSLIKENNLPFNIKGNKYVLYNYRCRNAV